MIDEKKEVKKRGKKNKKTKPLPRFAYETSVSFEARIFLVVDTVRDCMATGGKPHAAGGASPGEQTTEALTHVGAP